MGKIQLGKTVSLTVRDGEIALEEADIPSEPTLPADACEHP